jgi:hypothetical protein
MSSIMMGLERQTAEPLLCRPLEQPFGFFSLWECFMFRFCCISNTWWSDIAVHNAGLGLQHLEQERVKEEGDC